MISRLQGVIAEIEGESIILDVQGVGYELACSRSLVARCEIGGNITIPVYTDVKEDSIRLFGFDTKGEKEVFLLLNRVSGMGPRSSMDVVSNVAIRDLLRAIGASDVQSLMKIKGVGKKKAERIVVELRDLVATMADERSSSLREMITIHRSGQQSLSTLPQSVDKDAIAALEVLGFPRREAERAVNEATSALGGTQEVGDLVREALRHI
jgi:Holliday junction DNA helicase RuvA